MDIQYVLWEDYIAFNVILTIPPTILALHFTMYGPVAELKYIRTSSSIPVAVSYSTTEHSNSSQ